MMPLTCEEAALPLDCALIVNVINLPVPVTHRLYENHSNIVIFYQRTKGVIFLNEILPVRIHNAGLWNQGGKDGCMEGI